MTTALIIGAHGFSARHLARELTQHPDIHLIGVDILPDPPSGVDLHTYICADIADPDTASHLVAESRPDWVFNLAGATLGGFAAVLRTNLLAPVYLLDAVRAHAPDARVLLVGSAAEYGPIDPSMLPVTEDTPCRPVGDYGVSKYAATVAALELADRHGLRVVIARPFNLIGAGVPESLVIGAILQRAREALKGQGEPAVKVGNLDTERDFVAVEDSVRAYIAMLQGEFWGEVFNICSGKPVRIRDVVTMALSHAPRPIRIEVDPALVRQSDTPVVYGSFEKARRSFGFDPKIALADSLASAWEYQNSAIHNS